MDTNLTAGALLLRDSRFAVLAVKQNVCISLNTILYRLTTANLRVIAQKWILIKRHSIVTSYAAAYVFVGIV